MATVHRRHGRMDRRTNGRLTTTTTTAVAIPRNADTASRGKTYKIFVSPCISDVSLIITHRKCRFWKKVAYN